MMALSLSSERPSRLSSPACMQMKLPYFLKKGKCSLNFLEVALSFKPVIMAQKALVFPIPNSLYILPGSP